METFTAPPSLAAGYCGDCHEPIRVGETCCGELAGWIAPDGLAWNDYREYAIATGAGRMIDARGGHGTVPDEVLALDGDLFLAAVREADVSALLKRAVAEGWTTERLLARWDAIEGGS